MLVKAARWSEAAATTSTRLHVDRITPSWIDGNSRKRDKRVTHIGIFESDALAHFDGRAAVIEPDDDNVFVHDLFETPTMTAGKHGVAQKEIAEHDAKTEHREQRGLLASQASGDSAV